MIKNIPLRFWLALNQSTCLICTGQNDLTISGWSYVRATRKEDPKPRWANFVDWLFFWQEDHCLHALRWEYQQAQIMQHTYKDAYKIANDYLIAQAATAGEDHDR